MDAAYNRSSSHGQWLKNPQLRDTIMTSNRRDGLLVVAIPVSNPWPAGQPVYPSNGLSIETYEQESANRGKEGNAQRVPYGHF